MLPHNMFKYSVFSSPYKRQLEDKILITQKHSPAHKIFVTLQHTQSYSHTLQMAAKITTPGVKQ
jgi:hypothetical protein